MKKSILSFLLILIVSSSISAKTYELMSYNIENLFDATHDVVLGKEKDDWTFLPKETKGKEEACRKVSNKYYRQECFETDWTETKMDWKISQITDVVKAKNANLPDFLGVIEIENQNVLTKLAAKLGYEGFEITESPDNRGIDVALLYKKSPDLKLIAKKEWEVKLDYPTRNILECEFLLENKYPLTLFVNHWPSQASPDAARVKAAEVLKNRIMELTTKNPEHLIIAMGDFNVIDSNTVNPFKTVLLKDSNIFDLNETFFADAKIEKGIKDQMPKGSYYFAPKDEWNLLDRFFLSKNFQDAKDVEVDISKFEIFSPKFILKELTKKNSDSDDKGAKIVMVSRKFKENATTKDEIGYSDHFPIVMSFTTPEVKVIEKEVKTKEKAKKGKKK